VKYKIGNRFSDFYVYTLKYWPKLANCWKGLLCELFLLCMTKSWNP